MYKVLGTDQKVYGPVSMEQLTEWWNQGRVNAATLIQAEGATDWQPLSTLPRFSIPPAVSMPPSRPAYATEIGGGGGERHSTMAIISVICGLLGNVMCVCGFPFALVGLALSIIVINDDQRRSRGIAMAGLILSILALLLEVLEVMSGRWHYRSGMWRSP